MFSYSDALAPGTRPTVERLPFQGRPLLEFSKDWLAGTSFTGKPANLEPTPSHIPCGSSHLDHWSIALISARATRERPLAQTPRKRSKPGNPKLAGPAAPFLSCRSHSKGLCPRLPCSLCLMTEPVLPGGAWGVPCCPPLLGTCA